MEKSCGKRIKLGLIVASAKEERKGRKEKGTNLSLPENRRKTAEKRRQTVVIALSPVSAP